MHTIAVTPVDTGGFLDESKISTTETHQQQFQKKPKRLLFATMMSISQKLRSVHCKVNYFLLHVHT